ncbi:MAG TPA: serine/threonine protein kinase, partial [Nannocystis exedens]|nr:serine/threonine protein kinase [Nannocystis exedens]
MRFISWLALFLHSVTYAMIGVAVTDSVSNNDREARRATDAIDTIDALNRGRRAFVHLRRRAAAPAPAPGTAITLPKISSDELMVVGVLGEDTSGKVLHVYDHSRRKHVAVKQLSGPLSPLALARFRRGALLPARLRHPGIVEIYGFGRWPEGDPYFVMELVRGIELAALIDQAPSLRERLLLLRHITACAEAIGCAHREHIIHRDIKPENVLINSRGQAVVIDWGVAKDLGNIDIADDSDLMRAFGDDPRRTCAGAIIGTPPYMSPEQARGEPVDKRADVYALGALLLTVLTGVAPYSGDSAQAVVQAVIKGPPPALSLLPPSLRPGLVAV